MYKANYHTHTRLCNHAEGMTEDYVIEALNHHFTEIGMSDHNPVMEEFMTHNDFLKVWGYDAMNYSQISIYLQDLNKVKAKYGNQIKIYSGFECEFLEDHQDYYEELKSKVDYLNYGPHFFMHNHKIYNTYSDLNHKNLYLYGEACCNALNSGLFTIFVHPDLFMFAYQDKDGNRTFDDECIKVARKIIQCAIDNNVYIEINANGLNNSKVYGDGSWLYPCKEFWELVAHEFPKAKVVIGADAHKPKDLYNDNVVQVIAFAENLGINIVEKVIIK